MTIDRDPAARPGTPADGRETDHVLLVSRARVGLWAVWLALALLLFADARLVSHDLHWTLLVRLIQFALIGAASLLMRIDMRRPQRVASLVAFVSTFYVTSALAGYLRHDVETQPITDLAIAFATATTLPWGATAQLASVTVAVGAIGLGFYALDGTLAGTSPHMAAGLGLAFLVSVYIAHQLARYRRERDAAEAAVRHNEERFRALIERGSDIITIIDAEGFIRYESPSVERLVGYRPAELLGQKASSQLHPDDVALLRDAFARAVHGSAPPVACRVKRRDGSWCDVEAVLTNLLDHPAIGGIVVNWRDVGERKRAEEERARYVRELALARDQALASMHAKSMFLANVSHEIRTPMNVIIGMTDMVLDGELAPTQRTDLGRVRAAAMGLLAIINDILDASKIEAGRMTIEVVDMDLRRTIEDATSLLAPAATGKGLALTTAISPDLPAQVRGDPVRVRQTLVNLIGNAVKFTERGTVHVSVRVQKRTAAHVVVCLRVSDTGCGVPLDRQAVIFESFAQGEESTTRVYGGTGLGLAISRELVTLMGGRMGLESVPGQGSTFWIELTLECPVAAAVAAA